MVRSAEQKVNTGNSKAMRKPSKTKELRSQFQITISQHEEGIYLI